MGSLHFVSLNFELLRCLGYFFQLLHNTHFDIGHIYIHFIHFGFYGFLLRYVMAQTGRIAEPEGAAYRVSTSVPGLAGMVWRVD